MAFRRAVAEPDRPFAAMAQMIGDLLDGLGGDRGEARIRRARHRLPEGVHEGRQQELAQDGHGEIAVRPLDHQEVAVGGDVAQISERILVASFALDLARIGVKGASLADQVERDIGERQLLLEHRRVAAPFGQAMAVDQRRIGEAQRVDEGADLRSCVCERLRQPMRLRSAVHPRRARACAASEPPWRSRARLVVGAACRTSPRRFDGFAQPCRCALDQDLLELDQIPGRDIGSGAHEIAQDLEIMAQAELVAQALHLGVPLGDLAFRVEREEGEMVLMIDGRPCARDGAPPPCRLPSAFARRRARR